MKQSGFGTDVRTTLSENTPSESCSNGPFAGSLTFVFYLSRLDSIVGHFVSKSPTWTRTLVVFLLILAL